MIQPQNRFIRYIRNGTGPVGHHNSYRQRVFYCCHSYRVSYIAKSGGLKGYRTIGQFVTGSFGFE